MGKKRELSEYSRQELYDLVWSTPARKLAPDFDISDVAIAKRCKKLNVPRPSPGYWAKVAAGQTPSKTPLPPTNEEVFAKEARNPMPKSLPLPTRTAPLNPQASELLYALNKADLDSYKRTRLHDKPDFPDVLVSKDLAERVAKAFHVILAGLEPLGINWRKSRSSYNSGHFRKGQDRLQLAIAEDVIDPDGSRRCPPAYESRQSGKPCRLLTFSIKRPGYYSSEEIQKWSETNKLPLQEVLAQLVGAVRKHFLDAQERRAQEKIEWEKQRIESERRWREHERKEAIRLQQEKERKHAQAIAAAKKTRRTNLVKAAEDWRFCGSLLEFVEQCERHWKSEAKQLTPEQLDWLAWAKQAAGTASTFPADFPDPAKDGGFDPSSIPFGGPYPTSRNLDE
ncbi:MAG TPA: hypothetical protein VMH30_13775 [Verrucomicrobiae bacterium]|nr:hypothetical protein [Verrucomicrobiae bacterium]